MLDIYSLRLKTPHCCETVGRLPAGQESNLSGLGDGPSGVLLVGMCCIWHASRSRAASVADGSPSFYAPFDGSEKAAICRDGSPEPATARGLKFVPGVLAQAVYVGQHGKSPYDQMPLLEYEAAQHFTGTGGTVMFWVSPDWDGYFTDPQKFDWHFLFSALGGREAPDFISRDVPPGSGCDRISLFMWNWLRCDLFESPGKPNASLAWHCRNTWMRGDWWHVAFSWNGNGWGKLYVNGVPQAMKTTPKLTDIQRFYVGSLAKVWCRDYRANAAFDELRIYRRALTDDEVEGEFRRIAPFDFSMERRYLRAAVAEKVVVEISPGGGVRVPIAGRLLLRVLADTDGSVRAEKQIALNLSARESITMPVHELPVGSYRLECVLEREEARFCRSFPLTVYRQQEPPKVSNKRVQFGERIVSIDCTQTGNGFVESAPTQVKDVSGVGVYREAGDKNWDRFGYEVKIPNADGSPVMLEIAWPDDRERAMSFYMIPKSNAPQHRDRLSGGVQCGGEYPNSGTMQKARYLFYPGEEDYLFEARTLVPSLPAAVSRLEIFRLAERLPKLPVRMPPGQRGRDFGHLDEDQSFEVLLGGQRDSKYPRDSLPYGYPIRVFEKLLDYMDYTGQNVMSYSLARYTWTHLDNGPVNPVGNGMRSAGWVDLLLDMMQKRGKQLIANIHLFTMPESGSSPDRFEKRQTEGYFLTDRNGKVITNPWGGAPGFGNNPMHPAVRARFLEMLNEILRRFGKHPAFAGIDLWCESSTPCLWGSLEVGYDDLTVATFERETGITVPAAAQPAERFSTRYGYLTGPKRKEWLAWRAQKTTALLKEIDAAVRRTRPDLRLYLSVGGWYEGKPEFLDQEQCEDFDFSRFACENLGLDLKALKRLPSVVLVPMKDGTFYRWLKHWFGARENITHELNMNVEKFRVFRNGARSATSLYLRYFESFMTSLKQDTYQAYFQNSDPKAHDRYFLQDFAVALASQDAGQILIGAQPLGTTGRDDEAREFALAYRSLPVGDFSDVPGLTDPVMARFLNTNRGTYLYAVNLLWTPATATIGIPANSGGVIELTTGRHVKTEGRRLMVELKPFQLRSFLLAGPTAKPAGGRATVPMATREWYAAKATVIGRDIAALMESGGDARAQHQRFALIQNRIKEGRYAEAHRLMFSKLMREIPDLKAAAAGGYLKEMAAMVARSEYAIDCGSLGFYRAKSGRLFLPDRKYASGGFGYDGSYQAVNRSVEGLSGCDDPELFATEAYNLDAYRFTVKPGKYEVRLHFKVGYKPGAKPGVFVFNLDVEGRRVLSDYDVFIACGSDFSKAVVCEFRNVEVKDGVLDIEFSLPAGGSIDPTARLCDAIEVVPEP